MATSRFGSRVAPILLRLALGLTFLWAGLGKFAALEPVSGENAAILANMGVTLAPAPATTPASFAPPAAKPLSASDFPTPINTMRVNMIALMIHKAAHPAPKADGSEPMLLWPPKAAEGRLPVYFAWGASLAELVGGAFLLLGFLARLSALFVSGTMLGALWLANIGPALQSGNTRWGFLPNHELFAGGDASYVSVLWPLTLLMASLSVLLLGAGALSVDSLLFGTPKAPPPKPLPKPPA